VTALLRSTRFRRLARLRRRLRDAGYLRKWVILGALIGIIGGLGAVAFSLALTFATRFFLGILVGLTPAAPAGEGGDPITNALRPLALPFVVALGGLLAGIIVFRLAPEAEGHGTDAAIAAFHHHPRGIRARIPLVKLVASAITIGSGGSGGREGPTAQISAGFGSFLARFLDLDQRDARIAVAAGMAAGIGAIFRAPLGGAILGAELLYRDDVEADALVPSFVATIIAYSIFGALLGFQPIFGDQQRYTFSDPAQLPYYALIGLVAGLVGILYITNFYGLSGRFRSWRVPRELKPAAGGFLVGCIGLLIPGVLGTGYGWVQAGLDRQTLLALPLWMVLVLPFAKILATSLSIGSGGSGGVFGPGMVVGGLLGATIWRLLLPIGPGVPADPAPFVIVGMMALFGSVAHAPLAVMLMVAEMTGNLGMLAPAMVAVGLATFIVGQRSIYRSQVATRADSPAHRYRYAMPLMASLAAADAARQAVLVLAPGDRAGEALGRLDAAHLPGAPLTDRTGLYRGSVSRAQLAAALPETEVGGLTSPDAPFVAAADGLDDALGTLADERLSWAPVVADGRLVGVLSARDVMQAYRAALAGNVRQVRGLEGDGVLLDADLNAGSSLVGRRVADLALPTDSLLVSVRRGERLIVPRGDLRLAAGDHVSLFAAPVAETAARHLLSLPAVPTAEAAAAPGPDPNRVPAA
jgi:chloride channel protein, CIC family